MALDSSEAHQYYGNWRFALMKLIVGNFIERKPTSLSCLITPVIVPSPVQRRAGSVLGGVITEDFKGIMQGFIRVGTFV